MGKRLTFAFKYGLFCMFTAFLMVTVFAKHYHFDAGFAVPVITAFLAAFISGGLLFLKKRKFHHTRIGVLALILFLILSGFGFFLNRLFSIEEPFRNSFLHGQIEAWTNFLAGALIMIPAFVLLVYLAEEKKPKDPEDPSEASPISVEETK